jgi:hypothetical protein
LGYSVAFLSFAFPLLFLCFGKGLRQRKKAKAKGKGKSYLKTFGFEPKTFPLKEGHSTNRVLYSIIYSLAFARAKET